MGNGRLSVGFGVRSRRFRCWTPLSSRGVVVCPEEGAIPVLVTVASRAYSCGRPWSYHRIMAVVRLSKAHRFPLRKQRAGKHSGI
jgi:hypothetical protein